MDHNLCAENKLLFLLHASSVTSDALLVMKLKFQSRLWASAKLSTPALHSSSFSPRQSYLGSSQVPYVFPTPPL